ncbi:protein MFI [Candoia aspera]|uniref:protein MFI n=1 Tax=Candoia aspera TaxID=51853 RepID=UPI002FD7CCCF
MLIRKIKPFPRRASILRAILQEYKIAKTEGASARWNALNLQLETEHSEERPTFCNICLCGQGHSTHPGPEAKLRCFILLFRSFARPDAPIHRRRSQKLRCSRFAWRRFPLPAVSVPPPGGCCGNRDAFHGRPKSPPPESEGHRRAPGRFHLDQAGSGAGGREQRRARPGKYGRHFVKPRGLVEFFCDEKEEERTNAAYTIQRIWKRWLDIGVFEYYKELIGFKQYGEPSHLMKYIEPREAELLDAAAGVHIKFRLGGEKFPPSIYYKIFTHRPIVDMCANSPKDYTKIATKPSARKLQKESFNESSSDWYKRIENNGWRLLSIRYWKGLDSLTMKDNTKTQEFHHSTLQRKRDMEKRKKRRKIEWLKKMYFGENLQAKTENPRATVLIQRATEGLISSLEKEGIDEVMEWEVDEMLKWTNALNYEEYIQLWKEIGTSKSSESFKGFWFTQRYNVPELIPDRIQELVQSQMNVD